MPYIDQLNEENIHTDGLTERVPTNIQHLNDGWHSLRMWLPLSPHQAAY